MMLHNKIKDFKSVCVDPQKLLISCGCPVYVNPFQRTGLQLDQPHLQYYSLFIYLTLNYQFHIILAEY